MKRFENKVAIVTGGNAGIGRAAAVRFADEGAKVAILARTAASGEEVVRDIIGKGGDAVFFQTDVADEKQVDAAMAGVLKRYGEFHVAFNCSGISGEAKPFHQIDTAAFDHIVKTNLYGTFYCMKHEIAQFLKQGSGAIVNCGSVSSLVGVAGLSPYSASKHALAGITKSVALDYAAQGIQINLICPGGTATTMMSAYLESNPALRDAMNAAHPRGKLASPEEIVGLVMWLCSDDARNVVGQVFAIDGGYTIR